MIEKTFLDRVPTNPGRVIMTPVEGQANTYDMVRADNPLVVGTPLDKAAIDSIIQSRLTGRYYLPTVSRQTATGLYDIAANPIPTSWSGGGTAYTSGGYRISTNRNPEYNTSYLLPEAFDGKETTCVLWAVTGGAETNVTIELPSLIDVKKVKLKYENSGNVQLAIRGSVDGVTYETLYQDAVNSEFLTEYTLTRTGLYRFYKFSFTVSDSGSLSVYTIAFSSYDITTHRNDFILSSGVPNEWTNEQIICIATPVAASAVGVESNTLNGIPINTILQPAKRYELRYTGSMFVAKEV